MPCIESWSFKPLDVIESFFGIVEYVIPFLLKSQVVKFQSDE